MKTKKIIKRGIIVSLGVGFLFVATLLIHIVVMVQGKSPLPFATTQIARIDFNEEINPTQAQIIEDKFREFQGVKSTHFNLDDGILVYTFDNRLNDSKQIYDGFMKESNLLGSRYIVSEEDLSRGCPAIDNDSFYGKLTQVVSKVVN